MQFQTGSRGEKEEKKINISPLPVWGFGVEKGVGVWNKNPVVRARIYFDDVNMEKGWVLRE